LPLAISTSSSIRINKYLILNQPDSAAMAARVALLQGLVCVLLAAFVVYILGDNVGYIFTSNEDVIVRMWLLTLVLLQNKPFF
jgi:Na+-driven multidrug efflux pump